MVDYAVDVDVSVLGELVVLELDRSGGTSDRAGQGDVCGDGCGSVGTIPGSLGVGTKSFAFGLVMRATHLVSICETADVQQATCCMEHAISVCGKLRNLRVSYLIR